VGCEYAFMSVITVIVDQNLTVIAGSCNYSLVCFCTLRIRAWDHFEIQEVNRLLVFRHF